MFELKRLSVEAIPAALERAERYRLLNEPFDAESICEDVLAVEPGNQAAQVMLLLSLGGLSLWSAGRLAGRGRLPARLAFVGLAGPLLLVAGLRLPGPAGGGLIAERWDGLARAVAGGRPLAFPASVSWAVTSCWLRPDKARSPPDW